jgi:hypothetical protein
MTCRRLRIKGISLHSYRYAWAERAKTAGILRTSTSIKSISRPGNQDNKAKAFFEVSVCHLTGSRWGGKVDAMDP